jgi:response regulator RpfG family c-di-GMP phosphodiesterase
MLQTEKIKLLYVDDEENNLISLRASFRNEFKVFTALSAQEGLEVLSKERVHVIITDQRMPEVSGVEFLEQVLKFYPEPIRILLTGYSDLQAVVDAINKGQIYYYLNKPWNIEQLRATIYNAYEIFNLREQNEKLIEELARVNEQLEFLLRQKLLS